MTSVHRHLSEEELFDRVSAADALPELEGCARCGAEAESLRAFLADLQRADAQLTATTEWDDLLLRQRIREAVAREAPHGRSFFGRYAIFRPALASATLAVVALLVGGPLLWESAKPAPHFAALAPGNDRLPAWVPLPDESDDEGFAVLAEWTPNEDELALARCRTSCAAGLNSHEEETLLKEFARVPLTESTPL